MNTIQVILILITSYLLGALPTAYFVARGRGVNIFEVGSGNMGATNTARALGKRRYFFLVLLLDAMKGVAAVLVARAIVAPGFNVFLAESQISWAATVLAAIAVVVGHNWSIFATLLDQEHKIRGGKGAATAFGTFVTIAPAAMIVIISLIGAFIIARTKYVSLGALVMALLAFLWMLVLGAQGLIPMEYILYVLALGALIFYRFRENIQRLLSGTERRFGEHA